MDLTADSDSSTQIHTDSDFNRDLGDPGDTPGYLPDSFPPFPGPGACLWSSVFDDSGSGSVQGPVSGPGALFLVPASSQGAFLVEPVRASVVPPGRASGFQSRGLTAHAADTEGDPRAIQRFGKPFF